VVRAKFHYAIQVADLVAKPVFDQISDKFVRPGRRPVRSWLTTGLRHAHDTHSQVCVQVGDLVCDWIA